MSNRTYDILKWIATVVLPAITTLWLTIGHIWSIPYTEAIGATLAAVTTCVAALLGISSVKYQLEAKKGDK
jgi:hypothetical protein